jgi:predicted nucleic acid-binding protein
MLGPLIEAGLIATCGVIEFELGWATRTSAASGQLRADRDTGYEWLATRDEDWRRALDVQAALWRAGQIRAVGFPGLLIAAVAEREQVAVLHYDSDYDLIAEVTEPPDNRMLSKACWWICSQRHEGLAQPLQARPGARKTRVVTVHNADMARNESNRHAEGTDILRDYDPALCQRSFQYTPIVSSAKPRPVRR